MERSQAASRSAAPGAHPAHPLPARSRCLSGRTGTKGLPANFAGLAYFYLYVILDIFSRRVVGWCVADAEDTALFKALFDETFARHDVPAGQLTLHADRGGPMKAKATALLLADLGVTKSHMWTAPSLQDVFAVFGSDRLRSYVRP